eukprot:comp6639_c0_seq1/m.2413 comp6639_c0_seq1/g.2413  ORF comp6639_c0_seq1/g.2413 comp6639_c0_seq1/m.2413 type:complete len:166 (-) comp6639_c0_seq1:286-783(-)
MDSLPVSSQGALPGSPKPTLRRENEASTAHSAPKILGGGCYCGNIRYQITGPKKNETYCHCSICRRVISAPSVPWFTVSRKDFRIISGGEITYFRSSDKAKRGFCNKCGSGLTFESTDHPNEIDLTICSLDDPTKATPKDHIYVADALPWGTPDDNLPRHAQGRK